MSIAEWDYVNRLSDTNRKLTKLLRYYIRVYRVDDDEPDTEREVDRIFEQEMEKCI